MVQVNGNKMLDLAGLHPDDADPGLPEADLRERAVNSAIRRMEDLEKSFYSQQNRGSFSSRGELTPRTLSPLKSQRNSSRSLRSLKNVPENGLNDSVMNNNVSFTEKYSAISNGFASPRQFSLTTLNTHRDESTLFDRKPSSLSRSNLRPISRQLSAAKSFDYDEFEDMQLEQVKSYVKPRLILYKTEDIYTKACARCGITSSQNYARQVSSERKVAMANSSLSRLTVKPIAISLVRDHRIHTLDVSGNDIGPLGVMYIAEMLVENDTLYELNLSCTNPGRRGLEALAKNMAVNKSLHVLWLESNYLDHTETECLVDIMRDATSLSELHLGHNNLGYEGAKLIAKELEVNTRLHTLDLQWNHVRKESAKHICNALKCNIGLQSFNISWNGLGKEGCIALARALPKNKHLKSLDLTNNRIDIIALPFLLHGLVRNKTLENLQLAKNPMTTEGVKAVVRAVTGASNMALRYLNMEDIPVDKDFTELVKKMKSVRNIGVDHGVEMYGAIELQMKEHDPHDLNRFDPVMVLVEYMRIDNLRLIDLFQFFDTSSRGLVSRTDLRAGVATLGLPLTEYHLDLVMKDIDKKRDGYIDLEEFMNAQRDMSKVIIQRTTRAKGKGKEDLGLKELRQILKELVEKRNQRNKEKASTRVKSAALKRAKSAISSNKPGTPRTKSGKPGRERVITKKASLTVTKPKYSQGTATKTTR